MHQSLSGLFLPLSVSPARPRRTFGYTVGWPFPARGFRRFPFCCYRTPGFRRILFPFSFSFSFCPGFRASFPFPFSPGCECHLTHWSPEPGQRVVPLFCGGSIPLQRKGVKARDPVIARSSVATKREAAKAPGRKGLTNGIT